MPNVTWVETEFSEYLIFKWQFMYYSKITFDISSTGKCPTCLLSGKSGRQSVGFPHPHPLWGWLELRSLLKVWLTAGSFPQRDMPGPSFVLSLRLGGCVTEPVQLAERAKPNLTAVVCCCVKLALEGPSESCCWCNDEGRTLQAAKGKIKDWSHLFWWEWAVTV